MTTGLVAARAMAAGMAWHLHQERGAVSLAARGDLDPAQVAGRFAVAPAAGFDVNPVLLAAHGIAVRGPSPRALQIQTDDRELRAWSLADLNTYWRRWAAPTRQSRFVVAKLPSRRYAAWGIFGAPRLHYTLATGEIASKEEAGHYGEQELKSRTVWSGRRREPVALAAR
jgi:hypothetical protein